MTDTQDFKLRYPIGKFAKPEIINKEAIDGWITEIESLPGNLKFICNDLTDEQLKLRYREGGWTIRQVVHHIADSHLNSIIRYKWTLSEDTPTIKAYDEKAWAKLPDYNAPIDLSISLLEALHRRWTYLLRNITEDDYQNAYVHPSHGRQVPLTINTALYAWHGKHHVEHIKNALQNGGS